MSIPTEEPSVNPLPPTETFKPVKRKNNIGKVTLTVALTSLLAAGVGGGIGAGVATTAIVSQQQTGRQTSDTNTQTISDTKTPVLNDITSVIEKAQKSIVTVAVKSEQGSGTGSGVAIDNDGHIVTNSHVVTVGGLTKNGKISVQTADGSISDATIVGIDPTADLAVLKTDAKNLTPINFGDSKKVEVGNPTIAIGSPLGLSGTVTTGIVSALNRPITVASSEVKAQPQQENFFIPQQNTQPSQVALNVIQTDAAINPGNSGGALLDGNGNLIGINVAIASTAENNGSIGVGFAIPSDYVKQVADSLIENGSVTHGYLGVTVQDYTDDSFTTGAEIASVENDSPAAKAGLKEGDIVTKVNGSPIVSSTQFVATVKQSNINEELQLTVIRGGKTETVKTQLITQP